MRSPEEARDYLDARLNEDHICPGKACTRSYALEYIPTGSYVWHFTVVFYSDNSYDIQYNGLGREKEKILELLSDSNLSIELITNKKKIF